ncbi:hypothetical protein ES708_27346 [subsurface metagenome]
MLCLKRSKEGFTLIELMVVVAIITVLVVMGARFYSGQVDKARNAVVKANVSTIQFFIQAELLDETVSAVNSVVGTAGADSALIISASIHNPYTGTAQKRNGIAGVGGDPGDVYVTEIDGIFSINGNNADEKDVYATPLTARK